MQGSVWNIWDCACGGLEGGLKGTARWNWWMIEEDLDIAITITETLQEGRVEQINNWTHLNHSTHRHQRQIGQVESDSSSSSSSSSPPSPWSSEVWRTWQVIEEGLVIISPWDHFARLPPALWPSFACLAAVSLLSSNTNTKPSVHSTK